ncbi:MAG: response regulator [Armatimonadota bacterium]|nr:response regulator [Armatimonadota bacterium]MDR7426717.1 response regulator [Armatimonadota bacterium]MDR7463745.1 response regulator [Armatimonadota bacterium]MDR7469268.1 response regulator [Armatimonadota bacterium]MDR7475112.1 response regulator [Armatimonadota bacterium]
MSLRIVIADDEAVIRMGLRAMLQERGYRVVGEAGDGRRLLELVERLRPDLVFLDIKMPGLDGLAAAERLAQTYRLPVIVLTAYGDRDLVERARQAGVMGYLMKPLRETDLQPAIEVALARFRDLQALAEEVSGLQETLEVRKLVERAKGALMQRLGLAEEEAYRRIQRASRDTRRPMKEIARRILEGEDLP